jgi:iron complex transport system substrate-binding protein
MSLNIPDKVILKRTAKALLASWLFLFIATNAGNYPAQGSKEDGKLRIVSLAPSITEILFELGLDENLVGVSTWCNYPAQARSIEKVGNFTYPNIEKILSLKPDIVLLVGIEQAQTVKFLEAAGLNYLVINPLSVEELFDSIRKIASLTGATHKAESLIFEMKKKIAAIQKRLKDTPQDKRPKVFIEIWHDPLMTAGPNSFVGQLIELAGGANIAFDTMRPYSRFSPELVIKRNPDCIILGYMSQSGKITEVSNRIGWQEIAAVKNGRIYDDIDPSIIFRPGPRFVAGLDELYKRFYGKTK